MLKSMVAFTSPHGRYSLCHILNPTTAQIHQCKLAGAVLLSFIFPSSNTSEFIDVSEEVLSPLFPPRIPTLSGANIGQLRITRRGMWNLQRDQN